MHTVWLQCFRNDGGLSWTTCWTLNLVFKYSKNLLRKETKCSAVRMFPGTASAKNDDEILFQSIILRNPRLYSQFQVFLMYSKVEVKVLLVSAGHLCGHRPVFRYPKFVQTESKWIAIITSSRRDAMMLWRHIHGDGCLQTPIISD